MVAVGYASLPMTPSLRGFQREILQAVERPLIEASRKGTKVLEQTLTESAERAARKVERAKAREQKATEAVTQALKAEEIQRKKVGDAASQVATAQAKAAAVQERNTARIAEAERRLQAIRKADKSNVDAIAKAEQSLAAVRADAEAKALSASTAVEKARTKELEAVRKLESQEQATARAKNQAAAASENVLSATKQYDAAMLAAGNSTGGFRKHLNNLEAPMASIGSKLKSIAGLAAAGISFAGITSGLHSVISTGREFDKVLGTLQAVTGSTADDMQVMKQRARELGQDTDLAATSASSAADAMLALARGGMTAQQAMDAAKGSIQLAGAAQIDAGQAAEIQISALNAFQLEASEAGHVADVLTNAANNSATSITDLAQSLKMAAPTASTLGMSLEDTNTMIGLFANMGVKGSDAGTAIRSSLLSMTAPSKQAAQAMEELGLQAFDAQGQFVGMRSVFEQLEEAQQRLGSTEFTEKAARLFGREAIGFATTAATMGVKGWDDLRASMDKAGSAGETAKAAMAGLNSSFEKFQNSMEDLRLQIYEKISPSIATLLETLAKGIGAIGKTFEATNTFMQEHQGIASTLTGVISGLAGVIGGMAAINFAKWLWSATAGAQALVGALATNPIVLAGAAIGGLVGALVHFFKNTEYGQQLWEQFTGFLSQKIEAIKGFFQDLTGAAQGVWDILFHGDFTGMPFGIQEDSALVDWLFRIRDAAVEAKDRFTEFGGYLQGVGAGALEAVRGPLESVWQKTQDLAGTLGEFAGGALQTFWQKIQDLAGTVGEFAGGALQNLWDVLQSVWHVFQDNLGVFGMFWESIQELVVAVGQNLWQSLQSLWDVAQSLWGVFKSLWDTFTAVGSAVGELIGAFQPLWDLLAAVLIPVLKVLGGIILGTVVVAFMTLVGTITAVLKIATFLLNNVVTPLIKFFGQLATILADTLSTAFEWVAERIQGFTDKLQFVREHFGLMVSLMKEKAQELVDRVREKIGSLIQVFDDFKNNAIEAMRNAGHKMIDSIVNALKSGASRVWDAVKTLIPAKLRSTLSFNAVGSLSRFDTGGFENHAAQIAPAGAWRVWAEPETGGEAYIPLAMSKRPRSLAILDKVADMFGYNLVDNQGLKPRIPSVGQLTPKTMQFANGGILGEQEVLAKARVMHGTPYVFGGWSSAGTDCSGAVSLIVNLLKGLDMFAERMSTLNEGAWLESRGFQQGEGKPGDWRVGFLNGGPGGGHTAMQAPSGVFIESGGNTGGGFTIGSPAGPLSGRGFTDWYFMPASGMEQLNQAAHSLSGDAQGVVGSIATEKNISFGAAQSLFDQALKYVQGNGVGVYDQGGLLHHGQLGINLSRQTEAVLTNTQWGWLKSIAQNAGRPVDLGKELSQAFSGMLANQRGFMAFDPAVRDAEAGLAQVREQAAKQAGLIAQAEQQLAEARQSGDPEKVAQAEQAVASARNEAVASAQQVQAAERAVAAARIQAVQNITQIVFNAVQGFFDGVAKAVGVMAEIAASVEKARQEVSKLRMQLLTDTLGQIKAQRELRLAALGVSDARRKGILSILDAEKKVEEARLLVSRRAATSLNALGGEIDRFRETGVFSIGTVSSELIDSSKEVQAAQLELAKVRMSALIQEKEAQLRQAQAAYAAAEASLQQAHTLQLLQAATANLEQQAQNFYGMSSQGMSRAQQGFNGLSGLLGGLGKIAMGVVGGLSGFATGGPVGALIGAMPALTGIGEAIQGATAMRVYKDDMKEAWSNMDGAGKAAIIGGGLASIAGAAGGIMIAGTDPKAGMEFASAAGNLGGVIAGQPFNKAKMENDRSNSLYAEEVEKLNHKLAVDKAALEAMKSSDELKRLQEIDALKQAETVLELKKAFVEASSQKEAEKIRSLVEDAVTQYDQMVDYGRQQAEHLANIEEQARTLAKDNDREIPVITLPKGSAYSAEEVAELIGMLSSKLENLEAKVELVDDPTPSAREVVSARR